MSAPMESRRPKGRDVTDWHRQRAVRVLASRAVDAGELLELAAMLGLDPADGRAAETARKRRKQPPGARHTSGARPGRERGAQPAEQAVPDDRMVS